MKSFSFLSLILISSLALTLSASSVISLTKRLEEKAKITKKAKEVLEEEVLQEILKEKPYAFVKFYSPSCGPCVRIAPFFEQLAQTFSEHVNFIEINTHAHLATARRFSISSNPTFISCKQGIEIDRFTGAYQDKLRSKINVLVSQAKNVFSPTT
jgi:thioredoxin-like negative regulator of GroEL